MAQIERKNRSNLYQYLWGEISCATEFLESFDNDSSIYKKLNVYEYNESVAELYDQLKCEFWRIVKTELTPRQREVVELYCMNFTQCEIAKKLKVNQSSITKSLNGNVDYSTKDPKKHKTQYGGIIKKLIKLSSEDPKIIEILQKIRDLREDTWI